MSPPESKAERDLQALIDSFWDDPMLIPRSPEELARRGINIHELSESIPSIQIEEDSDNGVKDRMKISNLLNDETNTESAGNNNIAVLQDISNQVERPDNQELKPAGFPDCIFCGQKFDFHYKLEEHLITNHGYPPRKCPHCDNFTCARIVDIKRHVKVLHDLPTGRYHCYACILSSPDEEEMKLHIRANHSKCPYCSATYLRLSSHERVCQLHPKYAMPGQMKIDQE